MERIGTRLAAGMRKSIRPGVVKLRNFVEGRPAARKMMGEVKSIESLVAKGSNPLHAAYTRAQNYLSVFGELASNLREFQRFADTVRAAEDTYMPGWPPMSPISVSHFTGWALLDLPISDDDETICSCAAEVGRTFGIPLDFQRILDAMGQSFMGVYRRLEWDGNVVVLRDIFDGQTYRCIVPSGYRGTKDELWYVRLLPPMSDDDDYGVVFTSPYVLHGAAEADWHAFLDRQKKAFTQRGEEFDRRRFMKCGPEADFWNEFIFQGYRGHSDNAIELTGIPDLPDTLPLAPAGNRH